MEELLSVVFRALERLINFFIVRIVPVIYHGAIFTLKAMLISLAAIYTGWPTATYRIADEWRERAARMNIPSSMDRYMAPVMSVVAFFWVLYGWFIWSMITAWAFNSILRHFWGRWINF